MVFFMLNIIFRFNLTVQAKPYGCYLLAESPVTDATLPCSMLGNCVEDHTSRPPSDG